MSGSGRLRHAHRDQILWARPPSRAVCSSSPRGGDFELRLAQDLSIGYQDHDATGVRLSFHQSFVFRTPPPEAAAPVIA
ncbi:encapsulin [Streptomyces sp. NPDC047982]|uniref:encapsulin n=1 Tax=Streptomyces sp. NPDC047982 TaxID=3365495 RepID=UPI00371B3CE9